MEAKEFRTLTVEDLNGRVRGWKDELFRARFKGQNAETKDTSVFKKLRKDIARALTVISEKSVGVEVPVKAAKVTAKAAPVEKPVVEDKVSDKPASKTTKAKKTTKGSKA